MVKCCLSPQCTHHVPTGYMGPCPQCQLINLHHPSLHCHLHLFNPQIHLWNDTPVDPPKSMRNQDHLNVSRLSTTLWLIRPPVTPMNLNSTIRTQMINTMKHKLVTNSSQNLVSSPEHLPSSQLAKTLHPMRSNQLDQPWRMASCNASQNGLDSIHRDLQACSPSSWSQTDWL